MAITRKESDPRYQWDLTAIYKDGSEVDAAIAEAKSLISDLSFMTGPVDTNNAVKVLKTDSQVAEIVEKLYVYTHLKADEDSTDSESRAAAAKIELLLTEYSSASSFVAPALSRLTDAELDSIAESEPRFSRLIESVKREKSHCLSDEEEKLLAEGGSFIGDFQKVYMMFNNGDIRFDSVKDEDGVERELTHGTYSDFLQSKSPRVRRDAFIATHKAYKDNINFIAANYYAHVKKDVFLSRIRKYSSPIEMALYGEEISEKTYRTLLSAIDKGLPALHEYIDMRRRIVGDLHMYDLHFPLFEGGNGQPYEEAYETVYKALEPMGEEYRKIFREAKNNGWIDVYENKGKRSGAYSWSAYGTPHPYVLLNHSESMRDVFTLAHEMGHAIHSYYSNAAMPFEKAGYVIFVAEVASTVNEVLLLKNLLKTASGEERKALLSYYLDMFRTTMFRQAQFAEFEAFAHDEVNNGNPLTVDSLSDFYRELNHRYYGDSVVNDEYIRYEWARIPHFYNSFYVYKYATGFISAVSIAGAIEKGDIKRRDDYIRMLSLGGSMPPLDLLRVAGVDLESETPYEQALEEFRATLKMLEAEL